MSTCSKISSQKQTITIFAASHFVTSEDKLKLAVKNINLYHSEDQNIKNRKELYTKEGKDYFDGNIYVPNDLEVIEL